MLADGNPEVSKTQDIGKGPKEAVTHILKS